MTVQGSKTKLKDRHSRSFTLLKKRGNANIIDVEFYKHKSNSSSSNSSNTNSNIIDSAEIVDITAVNNNNATTTTTLLQPIKEDFNDHNEKVYFELLDYYRDKKLTESDIQDVLLNFTVTSGKIKSRTSTSTVINANNSTGNKTNILKTGTNYLKSSTKISPINSQYKQAFIEIILKVADYLETIETKVYERFWLSILYLNFWFPKLATYLRYVYIST